VGTAAGSPIPAIVTAGDRGAAKAVYGESKAFLEIEGRPLVAHVVLALQRVPEISHVWVVGDRKRLGAVFAAADVQGELRKPLHLIEQFSNLYENAWETYRRVLPAAPPEGRDPQSEEDLDMEVLYLSADLPFITPQEISEMIRGTQEKGVDYGLGLSRERSLDCFGQLEPGGNERAAKPAVEITYFNLREDRFKQNNLHLVRPARLGNRHLVQDMYEHRKQKELGNMIGLALQIFRQQAKWWIVTGYFCMQLAGLADRRGWRRLADWVRRGVTLAQVEDACGRIIDASFAFIVPEVGGCALDVDTEEEYDAIRENGRRWRAEQEAIAEKTVGPLPLPARAAAGGAL
jgi:hypothetical protein